MLGQVAGALSAAEQWPMGRTAVRAAELQSAAVVQAVAR